MIHSPLRSFHCQSFDKSSSSVWLSSLFLWGNSAQRLREGLDPLYLWPVRVQSRGITQKKKGREKGQMMGWADSNGWVKRTSEVRSSHKWRDVINNSSDTLHWDTVSVLPHHHSHQRRLCLSTVKKRAVNKCWETKIRVNEANRENINDSGWKKTATKRLISSNKKTD